MKLLLLAINSKYIHTNPAVYSLAACAKEYRKNISVLEMTINHRRDQIMEQVYLSNPDVIAVSCYIWNIAMVEQLIPEFAKILPDIPIWLGGPEVSYRPNELLLKYSQITGIMVGEGEKSFYELLRCYCLTQQDFSKVSGIVTRNTATALPQPMNMDDIPFWYDELFDSGRILYYESSRGCPFRCSYCLSSIDKELRFRSLDKTLQDIDRFLQARIAQVKFIDRTFNCNRKRAREIWKYLVEHDNGVTNFHFEIAGDLLEPEDIEIISKLRPGLVQFEIGVQTTNAETLEAIGRKTDMQVLAKNIIALRDLNNVHIHLDLIAGLPGEDMKSFHNSFNDVYAFAPEQLQLGFLKVLSGTRIEQQVKEYGIVYQSIPPYEVISTNEISYRDILKLKHVEEMLEIYYNSNQYVHTMAQLKKVFPNAFTMYEELSDYFETMGYFVQTPARMYRYEVLADFAKMKDEKNIELYRELLTYDAYLRENLKARPSFADSQEEFKSEIIDFYRKEEEERRFLPGYEKYDRKQMIKMTHMECFQYAVWDTEPKKLEEHKCVLFDYQVRNPLTGDARTLQI